MKSSTDPAPFDAPTPVVTNNGVHVENNGGMVNITITSAPLRCPHHGDQSSQWLETIEHFGVKIAIVAFGLLSAWGVIQQKFNDTAPSTGSRSVQQVAGQHP